MSQPSERTSARAVTQNLAMTMVREMAGLKSYPTTNEAVMRLVWLLAEHALSVAHARYVIDAFDEYCPTPKGLTDALEEPTIRERFGEKKPSQREQWEAECGPPDPDWSKKLIGVLTGGIKDQVEACHRQAVRDMLYSTEAAGRNETRDKRFWQDARAYDLKNHAALVAEIRADWPDEATS